MIQSNHSDIKVDLSKHALEKGVDTYYFDSEHDNPRVKDIKSYSTPAGMSRGYGVGNAIRSKFMSHGEVLENLIITPLLKAKNCVIMLDEPESGLSLKNQFKLINLINLAVKNKCQLFIATHCYPLIESFDVFSIEHKMKMPGSEFIQKNK
jgi:predicted ATPase